MEPFPGADPGGTPIPRASGRRSEGHKLGAQGSNLENLGPKPSGSASFPHRPSEPRQVPPPASSLTGTTRSLDPGRVRSAGLEPAATWPSTMPVYLFAARARGAATRGRTGPSAVRRRSRSRARRRNCPSWIRTTIDGFRGHCPAIGRKGTEYGRRESNSQAGSSEEARSARFPSLPCAPPETRTPFPRLRVGCITCHACSALRAVPGSRTPMICLEGKRLSR